MVILIISFQTLFCVVYMEFTQNKEILYSLGSSSDLVLHSSINRCVVNSRDAMAAHS